MLNPNPSHPGSSCYVLKLHRDSKPAEGQISGLLEHVGTGKTLAFADAQALVQGLLRHAAAVAEPARPSSR